MHFIMKEDLYRKSIHKKILGVLKKMSIFLCSMILYIIFISFIITGFIIVLDKFIDYIEPNYIIIEDKERKLSNDSLVSLMSIIVESNRVLVNERNTCEYYVLVHAKVPEYIKLSKEININPSNDLFLWIPVDYNTYENAIPGGNLATPNLVIGKVRYTGDIDHINLKIISREKREIKIK